MKLPPKGHYLKATLSLHKKGVKRPVKSASRIITPKGNYIDYQSKDRDFQMKQLIYK